MYLLKPPAVRDTEIFTAMPERFRKRGTHSAWANANKAGAQIDSFIEGPVFDAKGNLYVTDIPYGRIFRIDAAGDWDLVAEYDGEPNGMKFLNDRELLITDYKNGLTVLEIATGRTSVPSWIAVTASASRASTISCSIRGATSTSPTKARPECTTPPAGSTGWHLTASSMR